MTRDGLARRREWRLWSTGVALAVLVTVCFHVFVAPALEKAGLSEALVVFPAVGAVSGS